MDEWYAMVVMKAWSGVEVYWGDTNEKCRRAVWKVLERICPSTMIVLPRSYATRTKEMTVCDTLISVLDDLVLAGMSRPGTSRQRAVMGMW